MIGIEPESRTFLEPIRGSMFLLLFRIITLMMSTDVIYLIIRVVVFDLNKHWLPHRDITFGFLLFLASLYVLQLFIIMSILLRWLTKRYFIDKSNLIELKGIFTTRERTYDLKNLKSVIVDQGIMGKIFHFGTISIAITAPNLTEKIVLFEIPNPQETERLIKKFI